MFLLEIPTEYVGGGAGALAILASVMAYFIKRDRDTRKEHIADLKAANAEHVQLSREVVQAAVKGEQAERATAHGLLDIHEAQKKHTTAIENLTRTYRKGHG